MGDLLIEFFKLDIGSSGSPDFKRIKAFNYNYNKLVIINESELSGRSRRKRRYSNFQFPFGKNRGQASNDLLDG